MIPTYLYAPGASYLLTWPLLLMVLALGTIFISRIEMTSVKSIMILNLPLLPSVILIAPLMSLIIMGFGMQAIWILTAFAVFPLALYYAHLNLLLAFRTWLLPAASGGLGLCFIGTALLITDAGAISQKVNHIFYVLNADTGKAIWGSADRGPDEWTAQFFSSGTATASMAEHLPGVAGTFLKDDAPVAPLPPPNVVMINDQIEGGRRTLRLRVTSPRQAPVMSICWKKELKLEVMAVNGKRVAGQTPDVATLSSKYQRFTYHGIPEDGLELSFEVASAGPIELKVEDQSYGLTEIPGKSYGSRPSYIVASPFPYSDCTVVTKSVTF